MPRPFFAALVLAAAALASNPDDQPNVNSRYTIENCRVEGYRSSKISSTLRAELESVVGQKFDQMLLDRITEHIRRDLHVEKVSAKVSRGSVPEHVRIEFFIENQRSTDFDLGVPMFTYNSKQGWSGRGEVRTTIGGNKLVFAAVSDGNAGVDRFSGVEAKISRNIGSSRFLLGFEFDGYQEDWNRSTEDAIANSPELMGGLYKARRNFQPTMTIVLAEPLTLSFGVSMQSLERQFPAAMNESSNAVLTALRYHGSWTNGGLVQLLDADCMMRAGTRALGSDFAFMRNSLDARYQLTAGRNAVIVTFLAGRISGTAPLFEHFVLGNSNTLRGWNKFDLDPLGGTRVVHGSVEYRWRYFQAFYDTGAIWDQHTDPEQKQSVGVGVRSSSKDGILLAVAFPLKNGRMDPVFIAEINF
jgi:outer membrane protein assembly factor BamA